MSIEHTVVFRLVHAPGSTEEEPSSSRPAGGR